MKSTRASDSPILLFTAFEPSGDAHAAPVIREIQNQAPDATIYAWGGPKMEAAGATIVERTSEDGSMGLSALSKIRYVRRQVKAIRDFARSKGVALHVPVDSPAANFPVCKVLRRQGVKTVHLVAPQLWAWAPWRIRKLRKRTDLVLCLLPFEEAWFNGRGVKSKFIGHPVINRPLDENHLQDLAGLLPRGAPRVALFPGSRTHEVKKNLNLMLAAYKDCQRRHADVCGLIVAANQRLAKLIQARMGVPPPDTHVVTTDSDAVIHWCDCALCVSGTVSLDITRQCKPMVGVYRVNPISRFLSLFILRAKHRLLPNIIAQRRIVPEFVPYAGGPKRIADALSPLLTDSRNCAVQSAELKRVRSLFDGHDPGREAAGLILETLKAG